MADARLLPTNFLVWPKVRDLVPDVKLLLANFWSNPMVNSVGVSKPGILEWSSQATNLAASAILDQLRELELRKLVAWDPETGEIFAADWFRFHKFKGAIQAGLGREIAKIQSPKIREAVLSEIERCQPDLLKEARAKKEGGDDEGGGGGCPGGPPGQPPSLRSGRDANPKGKGPLATISGVVCWNQDDIWAVTNLVTVFGDRAVQDAVLRVLEAGKKPLRSVVEASLAGSAPKPAQRYSDQVGALRTAFPKRPGDPTEGAAHI